jgi:hypothetical protein
MTKRFYAVASLASLCLGLLIYLFFRNLNIVLFTWLPKPPVLDALFIPLKPSVFSSFLRYHLPDILWFLSGVLFVRFLWFNERKWQRLYIAAFYAIALILEISQVWERVPGTFDPLDLLFMGISAFVEGALYKYFCTRRCI